MTKEGIQRWWKSGADPKTMAQEVALDTSLCEDGAREVCNMEARERSPICEEEQQTR